MKKSESSKNCGLDKFNEMNKKYKIKSAEIRNLKNIDEILLNDKECPNCEKEGFIDIKKFKPLDEQLNLDELDNDFTRCSCGKRHIDIVMASILKIMKDENIELRRFTLRNGPTPLLTPMFSNKNEPFIEKNSLIILHPKFTKDIAKKIISEVSEVKGVIKGDPDDTVGLIDADSESISYELLVGSDIRSDIVQSPMGEMVINKIQHLSYLEFPPSMENKIKRLWEYIQTKQLSKEEIGNLTILDGTCGNGTLGIFLLKLGVKKVIFNDIWKPSTIMTSINICSNGFSMNKEIKYSANDYNISNGTNFEVYNLAFEELGEIFSKKIINKNNINNKNMNNDINNNNNINKMDNMNNNINSNINNINDNTDNNTNKKNTDGKKEFDMCILDCFPGANTNDLEKIAKSLAKDVLII